MVKLTRHWFRFERLPYPTPINLGVGVTAYDYEDAVGLLHERVFGESGLPKIRECTSDVDIRTLDQNHVIPNMGVVIYRGIWFPLGYDCPIESRVRETR